MAETHRIMIRLAPALYAQLAARGSAGQPLATMVREALLAYLTPPPRAATEQPEQASLDHEPAFDTTKYSLGQLCPRGHDYQGTGRTLRRLPRHVCPLCDKEQTQERRQAKHKAAM